ncbi:hypothetical protein QQ045_023242 [Rhodiola kirilowii]
MYTKSTYYTSADSLQIISKQTTKQTREHSHLRRRASTTPSAPEISQKISTCAALTVMLPFVAMRPPATTRAFLSDFEMHEHQVMTFILSWCNEHQYRAEYNDHIPR